MSEDKQVSGELAVQAVPEAKPIRDARTGRWLPGKPGGPGRPKGQRQNNPNSVEAVMRAVRQAATPKLMGEAVVALLEKAGKGDTAAFREVMNRLVGLPPQALDVYSRSEASDSLLHYLEIYHVGPGRQLPDEESE